MDNPIYIDRLGQVVTVKILLPTRPPRLNPCYFCVYKEKRHTKGSCGAYEPEEVDCTDFGMGGYWELVDSE